MKALRVLLAATLLAGTTLHAQLVNDGATNTLSNVTTNITGPVIVGTNGSFTLLVLSDNALLTNSANGIIGRSATAKSNEVRLISSTARWQMGGSLFVGSNGAASRLVVSNGALLENLDGNLGFTSASSNNSALITGPGSLWTNRGSFSISGAFLSNSRSNRIVVSDGAALVCGGGASVSGIGSQVLITGGGSRWASQSELSLNGTGNRMEVSEGAGLVSGSATIVGIAASGDNTVLLTGTGTAWTNNGSLAMGFSSSARALLTASNGATVFIGGNANFGALSGANLNRVLVTDPGTICTIGSELYVGGSSSGNLLAISNGGFVVSSNGFLGLGGSFNSALVTGAGSVWSNRNLLYIGAADRDNQLVVSNAGWVICSNGILGQAVGASSNAVVVTGAGSRWTTATAVGIGVNVGASGSGNRLVISDGGRVTGGSGQMGQTLGGSNNFALVTGSGSVWSNAFDLDIYQSNLLIVSNGGAVFNSAGRLGVGGGNNQAIVTGTNSLWRSSSFLGIGVNVSGNRLTVSNDGLVAADNIYVGLASISLNNRVVVDGGTLRSTNVSGTAALDVRRGTNVFNAGLIDVDQLLLTNSQGKFEFNGGTLITRGAVISNGLAFNVGNAGGTPAVWDVRAGAGGHFVSDYLVVGPSSSFNQLLVTNGAFLTNGIDAVMGDAPGANSNSVIISGAGSRWAANGRFNIGYSGAFNRLVISNGGMVANTRGVIGGGFTSSSNNAVLVTGAGSAWTNRQELWVGGSAGGNELVVSNGGTVSTVFGKTIGLIAGGNSNSVIVSDAGSRLLGNDTFYVGSDSSFNRLTIANGGQVTSALGVFGHQPTSSNNLALVTGTVSVWANAANLIVGEVGARNQLVVSNGATVFAGNNSFIGSAASATLNSVTVTDPGSRWLIATNLFVGSNGTFNRLVISNGATVVNRNTTIGRQPSPGMAGNNEVLVTGAGSVWSNTSTLGVGFNANGNRLVISNGAVVNSLFGRICESLSSNNLVVVTDPGSVWNSQFDVVVGSLGPFSRMIISNSAAVYTGNGAIGGFLFATNCEALVTGAGSLWWNQTNLIVGSGDGYNRLVATNGGEAVALGTIVLGAASPSTNNRIVVDGGAVRATNATGTGVLDIRRGTNVLNAGLVDVDILRLTNGPLSKFEFNRGTLSVKNSRVSIGPPLIIGNGISPATLDLVGNGTHDMSGTLGLIVSSNATLTGSGSLTVQLQVLTGAQLIPGASVGKISLSTPPFFFGTIAMEIAKNGATLTNDQIQVTGTVTYGGALTVSNLGPSTLAAGDRFPLFNATSYAGGFASVTLPPLPTALSWTNKLLVDGSIEVIAPPAIAMSSGTYTQSFDSLSLSGGNNPWRDNVTLLGWYAAKSVAPVNITNYIVSDGSSMAGALYSFGSTGSPERALGSIGSGTVGTISYGLSFLNDTGVTVSNFNFTFTGEQWRSSSSLNANTQTFWYRVSPSPITNPEPGVTTNWTQVTNLNFVSPVMLGTGVPLDGNQSTNRQVFAAVLLEGLLVPPGQNVFFRWQDLDDTGTDQGLAVDDLIVSFSQLPAERFWTNSLGGSYEVASNWLAHALVRAEDSANFTNNADYQVNWSTDALAASAFFNAQTGTVTQAVGPSSWTLTNSYVVGRDSVATAAVTHVSGSLFVTNAAGDAQFVVGKAGQGTFWLEAGTVETDWLFATNGLKSMFIFDGGTFRTRHAAVTNGQPFIIGDGLSPATFELLANGTLSVANSINVRSNATLRGDGTLLNHLFVSGTLSPGNPIGQLAIPGFLTFDFDSRAVFELNKAATTHDKVVGISNLFYRGTLIVTNVAGTLANGDNFKLFDFAARQASAFTNLILPALDPGLKWRNKLMMDGSLEVLTIPTRDFGVDVSHFQGESGVSQAAWNQMFADGKRFVFIKATEGLTGPHDAAMATNVARASAAGLLVGVYHFAHPENRPTTNGAILEASNLVVYAGSAIGPGRLRPVIDIEGNATTLSTAALTDWVIAFSDEIIARRGPGAAPIVYSSQNSANFEFDSRLANYDLWLRTIGGSNPATDDPINTLGFDPTGVFNEWSFWQYSDTGSSGGISPLDLDVCHSEYKPLSSYLIPGQPPAPSPIQLGSPVLTGNGLQFNFTNTPGAVFTVLATTNVSLPLSNWTVLGPVMENPPGQFQFADMQATNHPQRLYRVTSP